MSSTGPARARFGLALFTIVAAGSVANVYLYGVIGVAVCLSYLVGRSAQRDLDRGHRR